MIDFKLQLGCLILVLYFITAYIKGNAVKKVNCCEYFDALLYIAPWAIIFDGITAWTINHQEIVPYKVNFILHGIFFVLMMVTLILIFLYMIHLTVKIRSKKEIALLSLPGVLSIIFMLLTLSKVHFIEGKTSNYSMGLPVYICFASIAVHFLAIIVILAVKYRNIERRNGFGIFSFIVIDTLILAFQIIFKEALFTSLIPTITVIGFYVLFEDPNAKRLQVYNSNIVTGFATLVENRDDNTGGHIRRTKGYVKVIMDELMTNPKYAARISRDYYTNVINAAPMHDIGKIGTPDVILQKPAKLTDEEYEIIKQHAIRGGEIIKETFADLDEPEYQKIAYEVARFHHEKWNGKGYPDGLKEKEIPLHARIMAIADVFDAVSAKRCYRDALPVDTCFKIIQDGSGKDFDPELVSVFMNARNKIMEYYESDCEDSIYKIWNEERNK